MAIRGKLAAVATLVGSYAFPAHAPEFGRVGFRGEPAVATNHEAKYRQNLDANHYDAVFTARMGDKYSIVFPERVTVTAPASDGTVQLVQQQAVQQSAVSAVQPG